MEDLKNKIEAILFAVGDARAVEDLAKLTGAPAGDIKKAIAELRDDMKKRDSPLILLELGGGFKLNVSEKYLPLVQGIIPQTELSRPLMETLAVIAWKHPVLQSEVIKIRSTKAYEHVDALMESGFIVRERKGRSYLLKPTQKFFNYFDIPKNSLKDVFKGIEKVNIAGPQKVGELEVYDKKERDGALEVFTDKEEATVEVYDEDAGPSRPLSSILDEEAPGKKEAKPEEDSSGQEDESREKDKEDESQSEDEETDDNDVSSKKASKPAGKPDNDIDINEIYDEVKKDDAAKDDAEDEDEEDGDEQPRGKEKERQRKLPSQLEDALKEGKKIKKKDEFYFEEGK